MKKTLVIFAAFILVMPMFTIALVQASAIEDKNNDKFETYSVAGTYSALTVFAAEHQYVPSTEQVNKLIINYDESMLSYQITVGTHTYTMGTDFAYTGHAVFTYYDPVFTTYGLLFPTSFRSSQVRVDYMFDFSAYAGGIDGTLQMRAVSAEGGFFINSLAGTGDLQNVQVKATASGTIGTIVHLFHEGIVSGWPE